jgi:peptidoglycan/LPS O-acetylase OafA/YrhL
MSTLVRDRPRQLATGHFHLVHIPQAAERFAFGRPLLTALLLMVLYLAALVAAVASMSTSGPDTPITRLMLAVFGAVVMLYIAIGVWVAIPSHAPNER